jgi:hypothetical protein
MEKFWALSLTTLRASSLLRLFNKDLLGNLPGNLIKPSGWVILLRHFPSGIVLTLKPRSPIKAVKPTARHPKTVQPQLFYFVLLSVLVGR